MKPDGNMPESSEMEAKYSIKLGVIYQENGEDFEEGQSHLCLQ